MVATMSNDSSERSLDTPPGKRTPTICGDIDLRIAGDGTWYYHGSPIGRKELVRLFARVLVRESDGSFWLATPVEKARIRVDDAPFLGVELAQEGAGTGQTLRLRTNVDDWVVIGPGHPLRIACGQGGGEAKPYVSIRPGLDALVARPVYYELAGLAVKGPTENDAALGVWSAGRFFALEQSDPESPGTPSAM